MPWASGTSGNPKGRPPKSRALTTILEKAGNRTYKPEGADKGTARKKLLAEMLWGAAVTGCVTFPDGRSETLESSDWLNVVQFLYKHVDGPPKSSLLDVPEDTTVAINFVRVEGREAVAASDHTDDD